MKFKPLTSIEEVVKPIVEELGLIYVDCDFKKMSNGLTLTVYIDKKGGVGLDDCELVSKAIDEPIDVLDPTNGKAYNLNVSSPGLDRPIKKDIDFERCLGQNIEVKLFKPNMNGQKIFEGTLTSFDSETFTVKVLKDEIILNRIDAAHIVLALDF